MNISDMKGGTSSNNYAVAGGHHLRNKSGDRKKEGFITGPGGPIDIFVDVDSPSNPNVLMKSPSNASIHNVGRNGPGIEAAH